MLKREWIKQLITWGKNEHKKPLLVKGMRQVGKTTTIKKYAEDNFSNNYVYLNLLDEDDLSIFSGGFANVFATIEANKNITINDETLIIIDEVQLSENAYMFIKLLHDSDKPNNLICSGSYIENTIIHKDFKIPMGCYEEIVVYPLTFYEFAINKGEEKALIAVENSILSGEIISRPIHKRLLLLVNEYLIIGGMPNVVNIYINKIGGDDVYLSVEQELVILQDQQVVDIQRGLSVPSREKVVDIYNSIKTTIIKTKGIKLPKFKYTDIGKKNSSYSKYMNSIQVTTRSNILLPIYQTRSNLQKVDPSNKQLKLVYSDMGFLSNSLGIKEMAAKVNNDVQEKGYITENFVAIELQQFKQPIKYWYLLNNPDTKSKKSYEVDFLHYNNKNNISIPIEVKSGKNVRSISSLKKYKTLYNPKHSIIISSKPFYKGDHETNTKLPLYAIWMLDKYIDTI